MSKKYLFPVLLVLLSFAGCSSVPKADSEQKSTTVQNTETVKNDSKKTKSQKKESKNKAPLFEDWKYKGFGFELPQWVEAAYKKDSKALKKIIPQFTNKDLVLGGFAVDSDQAEKYINSSKILEGYTYYDSYWAKVNQEVEKTELPYVYLLIFTKN